MPLLLLCRGGAQLRGIGLVEQAARTHEPLLALFDLPAFIAHLAGVGFIRGGRCSNGGEQQEHGEQEGARRSGWAKWLHENPLEWKRVAVEHAVAPTAMRQAGALRNGRM